jgi:hypothetical protein
MTYIRTHLPDPEYLRELIEQEGETAVFKRYKKYESLMGNAESVKIVTEILYKFYNSKKSIKH